MTGIANIVKVDTHARPHVAALYLECGYGGGIGVADTAYAAIREEHIVAAVRLCGEHEYIVLRGMQVLPGFQQRGIGSRLLAACVSHLNDGVAFCLPYAHLARFYGAVGFTTAHQVVVPSFLQERQTRYAASGLTRSSCRVFQTFPATQYRADQRHMKP